MANTKSRSKSDEVVEVGLAKDLADTFRVGETKNLQLRTPRKGQAIARNSNGTPYANVFAVDEETGEEMWATACARHNVRLDFGLNEQVAQGAIKRLPVTRQDADGPLVILPPHMR